MKWLLLILPLLPATAMAQAVTPNFTTGTVNSTTTSTQTVAETINIKTYGGTQFSVTGSNVTPSGNLAATTTYTVTDATKDFSYSAVTLARRHHRRPKTSRAPSPLPLPRSRYLSSRNNAICR
jgi:hypothetical protein